MHNIDTFSSVPNSKASNTHHLRRILYSVTGIPTIFFFEAKQLANYRNRVIIITDHVPHLRNTVQVKNLTVRQAIS